MALEKLGDCIASRHMKKRGIVAKGNPYEIVKTDGGFGVKNTEKGTFRSRNIPRKRALRQFNLLEGIEHGNWRPTRGK